ncbi:MAG: hypothetical protein PUA57_01795 [Eggerthellales bacterium]|nr:hypothetical protein [Eggerthellales bacterium]
MNSVLEQIYSTIIPSAPFVIAAYALLWALLLAWLFVQFSKQRKLEKQLMLLEEQVEDLRADAARTPGE